MQYKYNKSINSKMYKRYIIQIMNLLYRLFISIRYQSNEPVK